MPGELVNARAPVKGVACSHPATREQQRSGPPPALSAGAAAARPPSGEQVLLSAENNDHAAALADELTTNATGLQHEASARLAVVIAVIERGGRGPYGVEGARDL
jgi:hypothetical protein